MEYYASSYTAVATGIGTAQAEALMPILKERNRGFASDAETWAELKVALERIKTKINSAERQHKDMWDAVKDKNTDGFEMLLEAFEQSARDVAGEWMRAAVLAKIAIDDPELPEEPTQEERITEARERLAAVERRQRLISDMLDVAQGELHTDLARELAQLSSEEGALRARLSVVGPEPDEDKAAEA